MAKLVNEAGKLNFMDARCEGELQVELAELTKLPVGFVAALGNIAWELGNHPDESKDMIELFLEYLDEMMED